MYDALLLVLTVGMGSTVLAFASRSLRGEDYRRRFLGLGAALVVGASLVVVVDHPIALLLAWLAVSRLTVALLRTGPEAGRTARSLRARRAFLLGDVALAGAVVLLLADGPTTAAGLLALVAAASRGAVAPLHRWLPDSIGAPTPASALLHAGVVGGGPLLLIVLWPDIGTSTTVAAATVLLGAASCIVAEAVMLTRPDVKGRLAWSTVAQMSFTLVLCGLGLPLAAGLHLVAHGLYKGTLFLGSGSGVRVAVRDRAAPSAGRPALGAAPAAVLGRVLPAGALAGAAWLAGGTWSTQLAVPLLLAAIAAGEATAAALRRTRSVAGAGAVLLSVSGLAATYAAFTVGLKEASADQLAATAPVLSAWWLAPLLLSLMAVAATRSRAHDGGPVGHLWALARRAGRPDPAFRIELPPVPRHQPALAHVPAPVPRPSLA